MPAHQELRRLLRQSHDLFPGDIDAWRRHVDKLVARLPKAIFDWDGLRSAARTPQRAEDYCRYFIDLVDFWAEHGGLAEQYSVDLLDALVDSCVQSLLDPEPGTGGEVPTGAQLRDELVALVLRRGGKTVHAIPEERAVSVAATVLGMVLARAEVQDTSIPLGEETPYIDVINFFLSLHQLPDELYEIDQGLDITETRDVRDEGNPFRTGPEGRKSWFLRVDLHLFLYLALLGDGRAPSTIRNVKTHLRLTLLSWALDHGLLDLAGWVAGLLDTGRGKPLTADVLREVAARRAALGLTWREAAFDFDSGSKTTEVRADLLFRLEEVGIPSPFRTEVAEQETDRRATGTGGPGLGNGVGDDDRGGPTR